MKKMIDNEKAMKLLQVADKVDFESDEMVIEGKLDVNGKITANNGVELAEGTILTVPSASNVFIKDESTNLDQALYAKQDKLVSGTNIKTINGNSVLGSGNIEISGGSGGTTLPYYVIFNVTSSAQRYSFYYYFATLPHDFLVEFLQALIDNVSDIARVLSDWGVESEDELVAKLQEGIDYYDEYTTVKAVFDWLIPLMNSTAPANAAEGGYSALMVATDGFAKTQAWQRMPSTGGYQLTELFGYYSASNTIAIVNTDDAADLPAMARIYYDSTTNTIKTTQFCTTQEYVDGKVSFTMEFSAW